MAILLTSPDFRRPRAKLQDMLWSDRSAEQGAASLRQELTALRRTLGEFAAVLYADRINVWLDRERFDTDCDVNGPTRLADMRGGEFLEGNTVRDPEFTDWLRDRRMQFEDMVPPQPTLLRADDMPDRPTLYLSYSQDSGPLSKHLASAISSGVQDWLPLHVREDMPTSPGKNALVLETDEVRLGRDAVVQVVLKDLEKKSPLWRAALEFDLRGKESFRSDLTRLINEAIDRTLATLSFDAHGFTPRNANTAIQAIERMFATHGDSYERLARVFEDEFKATGHGVFLAWRAFLSTYVIGERQRYDREALTEEAQDFVHRALVSEPHNPLVLALCSHVTAFTLGNHLSALELAERSVRLQPNSPLGWLFRGVALINLGRLPEGRSSITRARETTGEAPYRYLIDCFSCIAEMLSGEHGNAIAYGNTALSYAPEFAPTLRYLLATYLSVGDTSSAERTIRRLKKLEPDFDLSLLAEPEYPNPLMKKYEVIDLKKIPKLL